ncbi:hypothetical protein MSAN_00835600 [Mycena sanguinolenta]|uniref:F-box domain-containing protein n=1 Tax=Mycena sanguinolenta TaxID=230812 RepID=A0A8H6YWH6_9AGAR|nr:hypothetical protein MSAN_00835600 [Mycena sanguinolenta]
MAGLLDLPTEILVSILEYPVVSDTTVYFLALVCRQLHFVALPIYFSRQGLTPSSKSITINMHEDRRDLLAALKSALFIPDIENIKCIFPHPSCISIFPLLIHLARLETYISGLSSVKSVALHLDVRGSVCLSVGNDRSLRAWTAALESLLNCIVEKKCVSLTIMDGSQFTRAYEPTPPVTRQSKLARLLSAVPRLLRRSTKGMQEFRRVPRQGDAYIEMGIPLSVYRSSNLTSLEIHSTILVLPPGLHWTLAALRTCPITSLTLGRRIEESGGWWTALPLIASAATQLTSLTLWESNLMSHGGYTDSFTEVSTLDFISRLPQLRHIIISHKASTDFSETDGPPLNLPNLETISAPPTIILHMLRPPSPLPKIQSICVMWPQPPVSRTISLLATALQPIFQKPHPPRLSVSVKTSMYYPSGPFTIPIGDSTFAHRVDALEINVATYPPTDVAAMAAWIGLFPRVGQVDIQLSDSIQPGLRADLARLLRVVKLTDFFG